MPDAVTRNASLRRNHPKKSVLTEDTTSLLDVTADRGAGNAVLEDGRDLGGSCICGMVAVKKGRSGRKGIREIGITSNVDSGGRGKKETVVSIEQAEMYAMDLPGLAVA